MKKQQHIIKTQPCYLFLLICLTLLFETTVGQNCSVQCSSTASGCTVCFQKCQGSYAYSNCSFSSSQSTNPNSSQIGIVITQRECQSQCCSTELTQYGIQKFSNCEDDDSASKIRTIIIVSVSILIVIITCICCGNDTIRQKIAYCFCERLLRPGSKVAHTSHTHQSNAVNGEIRIERSNNYIRQNQSREIQNEKDLDQVKAVQL